MERLTIAFFGPTNSGKSTLVNAIAGQEVSLVSDVPGTTTDPVRKAVELPGLGPCVLIDTAGLDDSGVLGPERERRTRAVLDETDIAVLLDSPEVRPVVHYWDHQSQKPNQNAPGGPAFGPPATASALEELLSAISAAGIPLINYRRSESVGSLLERIAAARPKEEEQFLTGSLVKPGDTVLLVMPQDSEAPKGRLILPQVQIIRELLDRGCNPVCSTPQSLASAISSLKGAPALVIIDSQVFGFVNGSISADWPLTSFSVLLAGVKGDLRVFMDGAAAIDSLRPGDRVLIAEACTHVPDSEDIGRVKIPALLRKKVQCHPERSEGTLTVDIAAGNDFPEDLSPYSLIIHCGACVATSTLVRSRMRKALLAGVPITNYGIALAKLNGILGRISLP